MVSAFQSTHPHGVRRTSVSSKYSLYCVSIHAPAWGATRRASKMLHTEIVSIHAPAWGATRYSGRNFSKSGFQSTHPHGVRLGVHSRIMLIGCFNPRTRMGCDVLPFHLNTPSIVFQSTHPHGVRLKRNLITAKSSEFQSTHPHGVRQGFAVAFTANNSFNPRTRMGCDIVDVIFRSL